MGGPSAADVIRRTSNPRPTPHKRGVDSGHENDSNTLPHIMSRKIRYGMVGGGRGAFIGAVHRIAAAMDQQIDLVCGAFSSNAEKSKLSGADFFLTPERCYGTFEEMIKTEAKLPKDKRMDFVAIVTPNNMHFPPAK